MTHMEYEHTGMREERLDVVVANATGESRSKAQRLIKTGKVHVNGHPQTKPAYAVQPESTISVHMAMEDDYVSRGALKLLGAFDAFAPAGFTSVEGKHCLDIGASTGGFCDVLLRRGAAQVIALDVGHGQLDPRIADDPRVIEMSGVNMRYVGVDDLPYRPEVIVSDVSFISLTYLMPAIAEVAAPAAQIVLLVKPQFEVGQTGRLGKNGIVTDPSLRGQALERVERCAREHGLQVVASAPSPIEGTHGNAEYLLYLRMSQSS